MNPETYFTSPSYRLETLQHLQGLLAQHWINAPQSSKQEWWDKMEANSGYRDWETPNLSSGYYDRLYRDWETAMLS